MTRRVALTQATMEQAIRAARKEGMRVVVTEKGILFAEPGEVALPSPPTADPFDLVDMSR